MKITKQANAKLMTYVRNMAEKDALVSMQKIFTYSSEGATQIEEHGIEQLNSRIRFADALFEEVLTNIICYRAILYACNEVLAQMRPNIDLKKQYDTHYLHIKHDKFTGEIKVIDLPSLDKKQAVTLSFWLMESPWYRAVQLINFYCPDNLCQDCLRHDDAKIVRKKTHRQQLCNMSRYSILNEIFRSWHKTDQEPSIDNRLALKSRAKRSFINCFSWLQSKLPREIPIALYENVPRISEDEIPVSSDGDFELFYASLYRFRTHKKMTSKGFS
jgi:hypothetical protein